MLAGKTLATAAADTIAALTHPMLCFSEDDLSVLPGKAEGLKLITRANTAMPRTSPSAKTPMVSAPP